MYFPHVQKKVLYLVRSVTAHQLNNIGPQISKSNTPPDDKSVPGGEFTTSEPDPQNKHTKQDVSRCLGPPMKGGNTNNANIATYSGLCVNRGNITYV